MIDLELINLIGKENTWASCVEMDCYGLPIDEITAYLAAHVEHPSLNIGAGFRNYIEPTYALDGCSVNLLANPLPTSRKTEFDLDDIAHGIALPFESQSLKTAYMVSVWQYVADRKSLADEIMRIAKKMIIINVRNAGWGHLTVGPTSPSKIQRECEDCGYKCSVDTIVDDCYAVTVTTPHYAAP